MRHASFDGYDAENMAVIMETGTRVRANWLNQGKFYDARIVSIEPTGFCVQYLESEEVESGLKGRT